MENNFAEKFKKVVFDKMFEIQDNDQSIIRDLAVIGKNIGIETTSRSIARTATNKLIVDIVPQFKQAGLNFYTDSIVSRAICAQLIGEVSQGHKLLQGCSESLDLDKKSKESKQVQLTKSNNVNRFWAKFRQLFVKPASGWKKPTEEDIEKAKSYIDKYEKLDQKLWSYDLRDNIIPALVQQICPKDDFIYLPTTVTAIVDEDIAPKLEKLGLGDLIPKLEKELVQAYMENSEIGLEHCTTQDEIDLFVPNFEKYREEKRKKTNTSITSEKEMDMAIEQLTAATITTEEIEQDEH